MATGRPDDDTLRAWVGLLMTYRIVIPQLEADMVEQHGLPLTWFDVLNRLDQAPDGRLRMRDLEEQLVFMNSGITRLVDRIEAAGFVRRERADDDRRGVYIAITEAGHAKIDEAFPDHARSIEEHFGRHLDPRDAKALQRATAKILGHEADLHPNHGSRLPS